MWSLWIQPWRVTRQIASARNEWQSYMVDNLLFYTTLLDQITAKMSTRLNYSSMLLSLSKQNAPVLDSIAFKDVNAYLKIIEDVYLEFTDLAYWIEQCIFILCL